MIGIANKLMGVGGGCTSVSTIQEQKHSSDFRQE